MYTGTVTLYTIHSLQILLPAPHLSPRPELCLGGAPKMFHSPREWAPAGWPGPQMRSMDMTGCLGNIGTLGLDKTNDMWSTCSVSPAVGICNGIQYIEYDLRKQEKKERLQRKAAPNSDSKAARIWTTNHTLPVSASMMASTVRMSKPPKSCDATSAHCR